MGADGGSIPRRDELVKTRRAGTSDEAREQDEAKARARWTRCALTLEPLRAPVAVDRALGLMFNKDALIRALLAHDLPPHLQHIRSLKRDTVDARLYTLQVCIPPPPSHYQFFHNSLTTPCFTFTLICFGVVGAAHRTATRCCARARCAGRWCAR